MTDPGAGAKLNILQVMAGAPHGGAETAFVDMCIAMHQAGQNVTVATRANALRVPQLRAAGIPVYTLPFGGAIDVWTKMRLKSIIRKTRPQIVQTWMSRAAQKVPHWSPDCGAPRYLVVSRLGGYYKIKNFPATDFFTTITPDIRTFLIDNGVMPDRAMHINNFAETEDYADPAPRGALATPDDVPLILSLSRLHQAKAIDTLLQSLVDVPRAHLWIAGEGPDRAALEKLCADLGLSDRVRFLGWRDDRAALFRASDVCVFPSRYEPFGTVFVQAWAQGVPLVTSDADGPRQYVRDGIDGLVFPVDDVAALSAALRRVIDDAPLRESMAAAGLRRYMDEFTKDRTVGAYLDYYRAIMDRENMVLAA